MKISISRLLKILALILPIILLVSFMQTYLFGYVDQNTERFRRFYLEEKNSLDVVFMGASEVTTAFAPPLAYEQYGFTSYLYASDANPGSLYKYQLKEILSTQKPQVIVIEINGFLYPGEYQSDEARIHIFAENIPFSLNKVDAIFSSDVEDKINYLFPIIKYHGDWIKGNKLLETYEWKATKAAGPSMWKGVAAWTLQRPMESSDQQASNLEDPAIAEPYLIDFLEFCREKDISNIVFTRFPHRNYAAHTAKISRIEELLVQYGFPFLNLEKHIEEIGLDYHTDFYDTEHVNIYGQKKITDYLSTYLMREWIDTPIIQSEENIRHWQECVSSYGLFQAYATDLTENGIERWVGEDPYELGYFHEWLDAS